MSNQPPSTEPLTTNPLIEIVEIDRRQFLRIAGGALIALGTLGLAGCGGSGGSGGSGGQLAAAGGSVQLPSGVKVNLGTLTVANGLGQGTVTAQNTFSVSAAGANPSLAFLLDSTSRVIMMGFVTPGAANTLSPASTAAALLFFALEAYAASPADVQTLIQLISQDSRTATFANVVTTRIVANPYAVDQADAQIAAALAAAVGAMKGPAAVAPMKTSNQPRPQAQNLIIDGGTQSGLTVNQSADSSGFTVQNTLRRYAGIYVYETGTVDLTGVTTTYPTAKPVGTPLDLASTQRLNLFTAIGDVFASTSPFSPVNSTQLPLTLESGTSRTLYEIVVLGSSTSTIDPAFFSFARYAGEVPGWRSKLTSMNLRSGLGDILFGLLLNMIGVTSLNAIPLPTLDQAIAQLQATKLSAFEQAIQDTAEGLDMYGPIKYALTLIKGGGVPPEEFTTELFEYVDFLVTVGNKTAADAVSQVQFAKMIGVGFRSILGAISGASIVLGGVDLLAVVHDLSISDKGDLWSATVGLPSVKLTPTTATFVPGKSDPIQFVAAPAAGVTGKFVWTWTLLGGTTAQLTDEAGNQGTVLTKIASASVYLLTTPSDTQTLTVKVEGFDATTSASIGSATAVVTVQNGALGTVPVVITGFKWTSSINGSPSYCYGACYGLKPSIPGAKYYVLNANVTAGATITAAELAQPLPDLVTTATVYPIPKSMMPNGFVNLGGGIVAPIAYEGFSPTADQQTTSLNDVLAVMSSSFVWTAY